MKIAFAFVVGCLVVLMVSADEKYTTRWDYTDLDAILNNDRLLENYLKCLLEGLHCTREGEELRRVLPEAINNNCAKCSDKQKEGARKAITFIIKNKPETWTKLKQKFDPEGLHKDKYAAAEAEAAKTA